MGGSIPIRSPTFCFRVIPWIPWAATVFFLWVNDRLEAWTPTGMERDAAAVFLSSVFVDVPWAGFVGVPVAY